MYLLMCHRFDINLSFVQSSFTPLYPFLVKAFLPSYTHEIGYYSGLLTTAYYIPLLLFNPMWGYLSDKYGRKYVIVASLIVSSLTNIIIAFATSYHQIVIARIMAGCFGANSSVVKGFIGDLTQDQRLRSWSYSMYGSIFGVCGMIGPLIGGLLAFPVKLYPSLFSSNGFLFHYPFFIMSIIYAFMNLISVYLSYYYIKEKSALTVKKYEKVVDEEEVEAENITMESNPEKSTVNFVVLSWKTLGPIFLYCSIAFTCMTYYTLLPLFFAGSIEQGGLGLDSQNTSFLLSVCYTSSLLVSITNFVDKILVTVGCSTKTLMYAMLGYIPILLLFPLLTVTSGFTFYALEFLAVSLLGICEAQGFQAVILMITESQQSHNLGMFRLKHNRYLSILRIFR